MEKIQMLIATMNNKNAKILYEKMNLTSDALIINQSDYVAYEKYNVNNSLVECYTFNERGLSKSRNNALMRCTGDIICIADDDMVYTSTYEKDILDEFAKHPKADAIVFNVESTNSNRDGKKIKRFKRVGKIESKEYGSVHIAFRRNVLVKKNVFFDIFFGSGAIYSCGEDTIFLKDIIDKGAKLYKSPINIGKVDMGESSWFNGYNEEYFFNKGALIACMYPHICILLIFIQSIRNSKSKLGSYRKFFQLYTWYYKGAQDYKKR